MVRKTRSPKEGLVAVKGKKVKGFQYLRKIHEEEALGEFKVLLGIESGLEQQDVRSILM